MQQLGMVFIKSVLAMSHIDSFFALQFEAYFFSLGLCHSLVYDSKMFKPIMTKVPGCMDSTYTNTPVHCVNTVYCFFLDNLALITYAGAEKHLSQVYWHWSIVRGNASASLLVWLIHATGNKLRSLVPDSSHVANLVYHQVVSSTGYSGHPHYTVCMGV